MKSYELDYLISPDLSEEALKILQEKINSWIQEEKGFLGEINKPVKRILAYPIKKLAQAYLSSANFQLSPDGLLNIEKKLKNEGQIIRYLILVKRHRKINEKKMRRVIRKLEPPSMKAEFPKKNKAELETIEQKLEEILK